MDGKKILPFQRDQMGRICEVLGAPKRAWTCHMTGRKLMRVADQWPGIVHLPEYRTYTQSGP